MEIKAIFLAVPWGVSFLVTGLVVSAIQAACFLTIRPFSRNTFRRISGMVAEFLWLHIVFILDWWAGFEVKLYTDLKTSELMGIEHALVMPNHPCDVDTFTVWLLAQRSGCLRSALTVVKKSAQYLPIFGWATWFFEFVFLDRNWAKDEGKLKASLKAFRDFPRPFWLTIFVEGTRLTPDKLFEAQQFAISKGLPMPKNVLIPRTKGFVASVKNLRSFVPAVYDVAIAIEKGYSVPSLLSALKRQPCVINVHIKRYSMKDLPNSDEGIAEWCKERFVSKDLLVEKLQQQDKGILEQERIKGFENRSPQSLIVPVCCLFGISACMFPLLATREGCGIVAAIVAAAATLLHILIEFTRLPQQKANALAEGRN